MTVWGIFTAILLLLDKKTTQCYDDIRKKSSGQGAIPYWRYSPRLPANWQGLTRWNSGANSIVWMKEDAQKPSLHPLGYMDKEMSIRPVALWLRGFFHG